MVKNAKICSFEEKWFWVKFKSMLSAVGNNFKKKKHQTLEILTKVDFMHFLKYHIFEILKIHQWLVLKIMYALFLSEQEWPNRLEHDSSIL